MTTESSDSSPESGDLNEWNQAHSRRGPRAREFDAAAPAAALCPCARLPSWAGRGRLAGTSPPTSARDRYLPACVRLPSAQPAQHTVSTDRRTRSSHTLAIRLAYAPAPSPSPTFARALTHCPAWRPNSSRSSSGSSILLLRCVSFFCVQRIGRADGWLFVAACRRESSCCTAADLHPISKTNPLRLPCQRIQLTHGTARHELTRCASSVSHSQSTHTD